MSEHPRIPRPTPEQTHALTRAFTDSPAAVYEALDLFIPEDFYKLAWLADFTVATIRKYLADEKAVDEAMWAIIPSQDDYDVGTGPRLAIAFLNQDPDNLGALMAIATPSDAWDAFDVLATAAQSAVMEAFTGEHAANCDACRDSESED